MTNRIVGGFLILLFGLPAITASGQGQELSATPAEQFKAPHKQYESASSPSPASWRRHR